MKPRSLCNKEPAGGAGGKSGRSEARAALNPDGTEQMVQPNPEPRAPRRPGEKVSTLTCESREHSWVTRREPSVRTLKRRLQQDQKSDSKFSRGTNARGKGPCDSLLQAMVRMDTGGQVSSGPKG